MIRSQPTYKSVCHLELGTNGDEGNLPPPAGTGLSASEPDKTNLPESGKLDFLRETLCSWPDLGLLYGLNCSLQTCFAAGVADVA